MTDKCPACAQAVIDDFFYATRRCRACGHAWYPLALCQTDPKNLYGTEYFQGGEYANYLEDERALKLNFREYCRRMQKHLAPAAKIFEIGCAYGFFLEVARQIYAAQGLDVFPDVVEGAKARGNRVICGDFLQIPWSGETIDGICLWDCVEHLSEPLATFQLAAQRLNPDGKLFLTTGDLSSWVARWRGKKWRMLHPPTHLHYFTRASLEAMLAQAGLRLVEIRAIAQWHSLRNTLGGLARHAKEKMVAKGAAVIYSRLPAFLGNICFPIPTGDILWVVAQKIR